MSTNSVWEDGAERFMAIQHFSQERALHPALLALVERCPGNLLLDYGCGDGRILSRLSARWIIDAFEPSFRMRRIAQDNVGQNIRCLALDSSQLGGPYDVILLGMVILCIPNRDEVKSVLHRCSALMHESTRLFVTTTHPCFRDWRFSNFWTSYGEKQGFTYLEEGAPFEVTLRDPGTEGIVFTDYHWTLGFTINALVSSGLYVSSFIEVSDDPDSPSRNSQVPPFLILECRRIP